MLRTNETEVSQQRLLIMYAVQRNQSLLSLSSIVFKGYFTGHNQISKNITDTG